MKSVFAPGLSSAAVHGGIGALLTTEKREGKGVSCLGSLEIAKVPLSPEPSTAQGSSVRDTGRSFWASPLFLLFLSFLC